MRFKVDENLHDDVAETLRSRGHDAVTFRCGPSPAAGLRREGKV